MKVRGYEWLFLLVAAGGAVGVAVCLRQWFFRTTLTLLGCFVPLVLGVLAVMYAGAADSKLRRFARERRKQCASCGYDRRGIAGDARCPECGAVP